MLHSWWTSLLPSSLERSDSWRLWKAPHVTLGSEFENVLLMQSVWRPRRSDEMTLAVGGCLSHAGRCASRWSPCLSAQGQPAGGTSRLLSSGGEEEDPRGPALSPDSMQSPSQSQSQSCQTKPVGSGAPPAPPSSAAVDGKNRRGCVSNNKTDAEICARNRGRAPLPSSHSLFSAFWHISFPLISSLISLEPSSLAKSLRCRLRVPLVLGWDGAHGPRRSERAVIPQTAAEAWRG